MFPIWDFPLKTGTRNVRRVRELASFLFNQGFIPIVTFISPIRKERELARKLFKDGEFVEIYLSTPLDTCEKRDVKGLYAKHRETMAGVGSPYEPPENPELTFDTTSINVNEIIQNILKYLDN